MYVNPFWFGVMTTIGVEMVILVLAVFIVGGRGDDK